MDDFELEIKKEFINEALINLEEVEGAFMELESSAEPKALLDKIFRMAHNLKGGSRAVGFGDVAEFTHNLENLVLKIQKAEVALTSAVVTTLLRCNDRLIEMLNELKGDLNATFKNDDLIEEIKAWLEGRAAAAGETVAVAPANVEAVAVTHAEVPAPEVVAPEASAELAIADSAPAEASALDGIPSADAFFGPSEPVANVPAPAPVAAAPVTPIALAPDIKPESQATKTEKVSVGNDDEVIRVGLSRINMLNDYVGELIVLQSMIQQMAQTTHSAKLVASVQQMVKLSKDIQSVSMSMRMLPVKPLVQKLQRVVRDTAKALDKEVELKVIGDQIDIDKSVLDRLVDPLIHILRNAVDHGLESKADRQAAGKSISGVVQLLFANEGNHLIVEIKDDGKGINSEVLRTKAIEKGLISAQQSLSEKQLVNLIFHPGFSTKAATSEISGRGVGMDVVKTNVERIGGHIDIQTTVGKGSIFKLQIPLSLAVIDGMVVQAQHNRYVVPLIQVQETVNLNGFKIHHDKAGIGSCFELRGRVVPLFGLHNMLAQSSSVGEPETTCLIVNVDERPVGILVNEIIRSQQIVIKPIGNGISTQNGWIGCCVLGDGQPTLIVSPVDLLAGKLNHKLTAIELQNAA